MKKSSIIVGLISLALFTNCSSNDAEVEKVTKSPALAKLKLSAVTDIENKGNGADISINYSVTGVDLSAIKELRLFASTATDFTIEDLLQVPASNYHTITELNAQKDIDDASLNDTKGNPIVENQNYTISLLAIYKDEAAAPTLSNSKLLTLKNEIVVTTLKLPSNFLASEDIAIASNGTLYINEGFQGSKLYKITPDGTSSVLSNALNGSVGIALDSDENIYASNFNSRIINKITPDGTVTDYINDNRLVGGGGVTFDNDGNLYNTFYATRDIYKINSDTIEVVASSTVFNGPVGMTYDKEREKLFVASFDTGEIFYVAEDGTVTEIVDTDLTIGHLSYASNHFYATGWNQHKVYKIALDGEIVERIGSGNNQQKDGTVQEASFSQPNGIEATPDGSYIYVSQGNGKVRKIIMQRDN